MIRSQSRLMSRRGGTGGARQMKFFIDTADTAEIKSLAASGLLDGVTTNPSLIAKSGRRILFNHPLTDKGLAAFLADWVKTGQQLA